MRLSQAKTLSALVAAAMQIGRVSLIAMGRSLTGPKRPSIVSNAPGDWWSTEWWLTDGRHCMKHSVVQPVAMSWKVDLPNKRDEPWFVMIDLRGKVKHVIELYDKRTTVEELFGDDKNRDNGWLPAADPDDEGRTFRSAAVDVGVGVLAVCGCGRGGVATLSFLDGAQQQLGPRVQRFHDRPHPERANASLTIHGL